MHSCSCEHSLSSHAWEGGSPKLSLILSIIFLRAVSAPLPICLHHFPLSVSVAHREWDTGYKHSLSTNCMPGSALGIAMLNTNSTRSLKDEADLPAIRQVQQQRHVQSSLEHREGEPVLWRTSEGRCSGDRNCWAGPWTLGATEISGKGFAGRGNECAEGRWEAGQAQWLRVKMVWERGAWRNSYFSVY